MKFKKNTPPPGQNSSQEERDAWKYAAIMNRLEASEENNKKYGSRTLYMHFSALSYNTRKSHAERHGKLFTAQEVRDFWANPENIKGCKCGISPIIVDENGNPIAKNIQKRAQETYEKMKKRGYDWSK